MDALAAAIQFLTRLPVPSPATPPSDEVRGRSLLWFPVVGLLIGCVLWSVAFIADPSDGARLVAPALVVLAWAALTGGLHLDGLADAADGWIGGQGDRERTLAIMKDPASGPAGVVALVLVLLLKFAAAAAVAAHDPALLILSPFIGRGLLTSLFLTTPYVRAGGLGEPLARHRPAATGWIVLVAYAAAAVLLFGLLALWAVLAAAIWLFLFRAWLMRLLGGTTGDTAGALVETTEAWVLVVLALA